MIGSVCFGIPVHSDELSGWLLLQHRVVLALNEGGTEGHDEDSIFVGAFFIAGFSAVHTPTVEASRRAGYILDFRIQFICIGGHAETNTHRAAIDADRTARLFS